MRIIEAFKRKPTAFLLWLLLVIIVIIIFGLILAPTIFYDQWIWKHYWGPVVADAQNSAGFAYHNDIAAYEGYTIVSELTYGIILVFALFAIYKLLKRLKIAVDWKFALALMPYILFGPVSRVLEDSGYFEEPIAYWFISPLIYLQIAFFALLFLFIGYFLEKKYNKPRLTVNTVIFLGGLILLLPSFCVPSPQIFLCEITSF